MHKAPHKFSCWHPNTPPASTINWKPAQRTSNVVTSWGTQVAAKGKSKMSISPTVLGFCHHKGPQQLCPAPTQHLFQRTGSQKNVLTTKQAAGALAHHPSAQEPFALPSQGALPVSTAHHTELLQSGDFRSQNRPLSLPAPQALPSQSYRFFS